MSEEFEIKNDVLTLTSDIGVTHVAALYEALAECLEGGCDKFTIDASAVSRVDGAFLQLMASFISAMKDEANAEIAWVSPSDALVSAVEVLDLRGVMHLH